MTSRELVVGALNGSMVERVARDFRATARLASLREDELEEMRFRYGTDIEPADFQFPRGSRAKGTPGKVGHYTDAWGCVWQVTERGTEGQIVEHPLADAESAGEYHPPTELLDGLTPNRVARTAATDSRFILADTLTQPVRRMGQLRGPQAALADLSRGSRRAADLLRRLHDFSVRELAAWAASDVDGVAIEDDFGERSSVPIKPRAWQDLLKPLYREYCEILHAHDKFVFFQTPGSVEPILEDLIEIGIDAVDGHLSAMDLEQVADRVRGRIAFWAQVDMTDGSGPVPPSICADAVSHIRKILDYGQGGIIAKCRWEVDTPFENVAAVLERWFQPVPTCF